MFCVRSASRSVVGFKLGAITAPRNGRMWLETVWYRLLKWVTGLAAAYFLLAVLEHTGSWWKTGIWTPFTIADFLMEWHLPLPKAPNFIMLDKIVDDLLGLPGVFAYAAVLCCLMVILGWAAGGLDGLENKKREAARTKIGAD
jgi:hypothetical protein